MWNGGLFRSASELEGLVVTEPESMSVYKLQLALCNAVALLFSTSAAFFSRPARIQTSHSPFENSNGVYGLRTFLHISVQTCR